MRPTEKIENLIQNLNDQTRPELDRKILDDCFAALQTQPAPHRSVRPSQWSKRMNTPMTKYAAAAVVILAALAGIYHMTGSIDGAGVAWAQVVEQLNQHEKYKCRQRVVRADGDQLPVMDVYHINLSLRRQEVEDGSIHIIDMQNEDAVTVELQPDRRKAVVTKLLGFGPKKDPDIIDMVKRFDQASTERLGTKKRDGRVLYGFHHQPNENNDFTVWVDAESRLPVEIELIHIADGQLRQTIYLDQFEFDFNLPMSAFSTDIPEGYAVETMVQDYRPVQPEPVSPEIIQQQLQHAAYTLDPLPWMEQTTTIRTTDPVGSRAVIFMTGIKTVDGATMVLAQGDYYSLDIMTWLHDQQVVLETPAGIKVMTHPNAAIYAEHFLESFASACPPFDGPDPEVEPFTRMIVMPNKSVLGLSSNRPLPLERMQQLAEALVEIRD